MQQTNFLFSYMMINVPSVVEKNVENKDWMQDYMLDLVTEFKNKGAPGIHLFVITNNDGTNKLIEKIMKKFA